jgi:hypothetical protein
MANLIIHIGPHKTLSTLMQAIFSEVIPSSLSTGANKILYPLNDQNQNLNHANLANSSLGLENQALDSNCIERWIQENGLSQQTVLVSAENFCRDIETDFQNLFEATKFAESLSIIIAEREFSKRSVGIVNELLLNQEVTPADQYLLSNPSFAMTYAYCQLNYLTKICNTFKNRLKEVVVIDFRGTCDVLTSMKKLFHHFEISLDATQQLKMELMCSHRVNEGMHPAHREMIINLTKNQAKKIPDEQWRLVCDKIKGIDPVFLQGALFDHILFDQRSLLLSELDRIQDVLFEKSLADNKSLVTVI